MDFLEKYNLTPIKIVKFLALILLGIVILSVAFSFINNTLRSVSSGNYNQAPAMYSGGFMDSEEMMMESGMSKGINLSSRNIMPQINNYTPGVDAEDFEITEYRATVETRNLEKSCDAITSLKPSDYVIFESANRGENNCNFRFKVKKENVAEVLAIVKSLDPREMNESVETIKKQIDDFTSQEEVLKRKLQSVEDTLSTAIVAYDEISKLATKTSDATSLANIIESKIRIIEKLSQEKINIITQLESISRLKSEKLDKLEYTYFNINIYENKYIDIDSLKDSWKSSIKYFVFDMNRVLQDLSVGLVTLAMYTFQYLLYLVIMVITGKYVWKLFKRIWKS